METVLAHKTVETTPTTRICQLLPKQFSKSSMNVTDCIYDYCRLTRYCARKHINNCNVMKCKKCRDWKFFMYNKAKLYSKMNNDYPDNTAFLYMYAFQLYQQKKYNQCIKLLQDTDFNHEYPLILFVMASCYQQLGEGFRAIKCYKDAQVEDWDFITDCSELNVSEHKLKVAVFIQLGKSFDFVLTTTHINEWKPKYMNDLLLHKEAMNIGSSNNNGIIRMTDVIKLCYWNNNYTKGYNNILKLIDILNTTPSFEIQRGSASTINLLLLNMGKLSTWKRIFVMLQNHIPNTKRLFNLSFQRFMGIMEGDDETDLVIKLVKSLKQRPGNYYIDLMGINGDFIGINKWFSSLCVEIICVSKQELAKQGRDGLDIALFEFLYFNAKYRYYYLKHHKIALLLFRMALKQNKYDPMCYLDMALLMKDCNKYQLSLKYLNKAKTLNEMVYNINNGPMIECQVLKLQNKIFHQNKMLWNECNWCRKKLKSIQKCKQCKSVYYCCRSHQKLDWKSVHRNYCRYHKKSKIKYKLFAYFLKSSQIT